MNKEKQKTKRQHYVPQSYLKRFAPDGQNLYVFDKFAKKAFGPTNVLNVAHENYFYDIPAEAIASVASAVNIDPQSPEKLLASLDKEFNEIIEVALKFAKGGPATPEQRIKMALCAAIQLMRTRDFRDELIQSMEQIGRAVSEAWLKLAEPDLASEVSVSFKYREDSVPVLHNQFLWNPEYLSGAAVVLATHIWLIGINQTTVPLYTSDTPLVRRAHTPPSWFVPEIKPRSADEISIKIALESERPGIGSEGVEIIFPLSPECALIFLERNFFKSLAERDGGRIILDPTQVETFNRLQVLQSYRQVYSPINDFSLAEEVYREHPEACSRHRKRIQVNAWT